MLTALLSTVGLNHQRGRGGGGGRRGGIHWQLLVLQMSIRGHLGKCLFVAVLQSILNRDGIDWECNAFCSSGTFYFEGALNEHKRTLSGEQAGYLPMPVLSLYVVVMIQCPAEPSPHTAL